MIELADAVLTTVVGGLAKVTPKSHRRVAWMLFAEFCIFVGFDVYMKAKGIEAAPLIYAIRSLIYTAFILAFAICGAFYLSFISSLISFYQAIGIFFNHTIWFDGSHYFWVMLAFCLLQIGGLLPGVFHGHRLEPGNTLNERRIHTRHHYTG